jgi:hypothetical protein
MGVWADQGQGPVLTIGPYGKEPWHHTWEVSAQTGATWDLNPLERYKRIVLQFLNVDNTLNQIRIDAPESFGVPETVQSELVGSLADNQDSSALAVSAAWRQLTANLRQRYRGRVSFARCRDAQSGREAPYEVRAGDLIRITDFSIDGSLTLRIHDVSFTPEGVTVGIEAPALPLGGAVSGAQGRATSARPLSSTSSGVATYLPPGASAGGAPGPGEGVGIGEGLAPPGLPSDWWKRWFR